MCFRFATASNDRKTFRVLSGKEIAEYVLFADHFSSGIIESISREIELHANKQTFQPTLAILQIGVTEDSNIHIRQQIKIASLCGIHIKVVPLPRDSTLVDIRIQINSLNGNSNIHGIILQLPIVSKHNYTVKDVANNIHPDKDVDGLSSIQASILSKYNLRASHANDPRLLHVPCAAAACFLMLQETGVDLTGSRCVVVGQGQLVGVPVVNLLRNCTTCTVITCQRSTPCLGRQIHRADIVISGTGHPRLVKGEWIKPGAIVIDCGINVLYCGEKRKIVGDVDFEEAKHNASWITPVPGGIGPLAVALLLRNTLNAYKKLCGITTHPPFMEATGILL